MSKFKVWGSDGCRECEYGRITLFVHTDRCIQCAPQDYEKPADTVREEFEAKVILLDVDDDVPVIVLHDATKLKDGDRVRVTLERVE